MTRLGLLIAFVIAGVSPAAAQTLSQITLDQGNSTVRNDSDLGIGVQFSSNLTSPATVSLSSSNAALVPVPATMIVQPTGTGVPSSYGTHVPVGHVTLNTNVTITATHGATTVQRTLTIVPSTAPTAPALIADYLWVYTGFGDCFSWITPPRGSMKQYTFEYKNVFSPGLDDPVNLRVYLTYPPSKTPGSDGPFPTVVMLHGGGWYDKPVPDTQNPAPPHGNPTWWLPMAHYFASRGMAAVILQYRVAGTHDATVAQAVADVRSGIRWLRKYATSLSIDTDEIVLVGDSAGGHLALTSQMAASTLSDEWGTSDQSLSTSAAGVAAFYPVVGAAVPDAAARLPASIRPSDLLSSSFPTLVLQGEDDQHTWTPPAAAVNFCTAMNNLQLADPCKVEGFPGEDHNFLASPPASNPPPEAAYVVGIRKLDQWMVDLLPSYYGNVADSWITGAEDHCQYEDDFYGYWPSPAAAADSWSEYYYYQWGAVPPSPNSPGYGRW